MGRLVVDMFVTLDGVMQAPGDTSEDREEGFTHGGWQAPYFDDESGQVITEQMQTVDALLLGRKTYQLFASFWPKAPADDPIAGHLNKVRKYVASRTLKTVEWNNSRLIEGDVADGVKRIKQDHDEIHVIGSGNLVQTLLREELIDRLKPVGLSGALRDR
jgi:dihydrofolate reductase